MRVGYAFAGSIISPSFTPTRTSHRTATTQPVISNATVHSRNLFIAQKHHRIRQNSSIEDSVPLKSLDPVYCATYTGPEFCTNEPLFLWKWNTSTNSSSHILSCAATKTRLTSFVSTKVKFRCHKCLCRYYNSNSVQYRHNLQM